MSAAGRLLANHGNMSWKGSDSIGCSGFLEKAMVLCYALCTNCAFCCLKASFHFSSFQFTQLVITSADETYSDVFVFLCAQIPVFVLEFIFGAVTPQPISKVGVRYGRLQCLRMPVNCGSRNENSYKRSFHFSSPSSISDKSPFSCSRKTVHVTANVEYFWEGSTLWWLKMVFCCPFISSCDLKLFIKILE